MPALANTVEGNLLAQGHRYAICVSRFNSFITEKLLEGAVDALVRHGAAPADVTVYRCAGTWELGPLAARVIRAGKLDGLVALGCLIRGATDHYDLLASEVSKALAHLSIEGSVAAQPVSVTFGVLATENIEQAIERAGTKSGNKGADAALACIEQVNLLRAIPVKG
jgi:6,7-dimethyl-8-ribityllumazine synthase